MYHFSSLYKELDASLIAEQMEVVMIFPCVVDHNLNKDLQVAVSINELKYTFISLIKAKSPSLDGLTVVFYLGFYVLMEDDILKVIEESRSKGMVLGEINSTFMTLIPKVNETRSFDDFRPILLCNVFYKSISKIIANRLKRVLARVISKEQFSFITKRQIHDAVRSMQEGFHSIKTKNMLAIVMKLDLSKAYDRVNWLFLCLVLLHIGISLPIINWILGHVSSTSFATLINGSPDRFFRASRGLRHGCPMSPFCSC
jgi:hypothetical protein